MILKNKNITFVLYGYPLGVSTMLINAIQMLKDNNNNVTVLVNDDYQKNTPCEQWLEDIIISLPTKENNLLFRIKRKILNIVLPNRKISWKEKNIGIFSFSKQIKKYLKKKSIDILMPVEAYSLISVDNAISKKSNHEIFYFDMELLDWNSENPLYSDKLELKKYQYNALKNTKKTIITSFNRAKIFSKINKYSFKNIYVLPVVPRKRELKTKSDYFRKKFNINENKYIVLYSGNFMPWAQCLEIIKNVKLWDNDVILIMHTWNKDSKNTDYFKKMKKEANNLNVIFSFDYLTYDELALAMSSADIGLMYYQEIDDNFTEICFSSNKMGEYLASGLPVICSPFENLKIFVEKNKIGLSVAHNEIHLALNQILLQTDEYIKNVQKCVDEYFTFEKYFNKAFNKQEH